MRTKIRAAALFLALTVALPVLAFAEGEGDLPHAENDIRNRPSLQRGARNFMNYCSGCHSAQFVRFNRIGADLGIADAELKANLMFATDKTFDTIKASMSSADARKWFGNAPPDLSLMARARGTDYLYNFLLSFYADPSRPTGVNNTILPGTAMPHVLADLQGVQTAVFAPKNKDAKDGDAAGGEFERFNLANPGTLTPEQYQEFVRDTVNFLDYIGEPVQVKRRDLGVWVLLFLLVFTGFAFLLKREYFRDIH
jgi:ubiquinol-cytochrome c reductase cytochrome c1 subunit